MARPNQHAAIAEDPIISSLEPGKDRMWGYADEVDVELPRALAPSR